MNTTRKDFSRVTSPRPLAMLSDPFVFTPTPHTPSSGTPSPVLPESPYSPFPRAAGAKEKHAWYNRHGLPENQEEYWKHCGELFPDICPWLQSPVQSLGTVRRFVLMLPKKIHPFVYPATTQQNPSKPQSRQEPRKGTTCCYPCCKNNLTY